ncbi:MAG TPA: PQQ-binding-like beta-propeller repeat protein [Pirellulales bacterium]|nr:PQQ-binding-like beta-propeller repeat protein [Pirellulales bacterium]
MNARFAARICCTLGLLTLLSAATPGRLAAQEWTRFRGPNGTGVGEADIPGEWTEKDYHWRVELPGIGHSCPVLWGDKIFLTSAFEDTCTRIVLCLDAADGKILWRREFTSTQHTKHPMNSFASCTPAVDEERVYVAWTAPEEYTLMALDHEGRDVWQRNLGPFVSQHSGGTSPVIYKGMVILGNDQGDEDANGVSFLNAFDRRSGEPLWQRARQTEQVAYSTPCVFSRPGKPDELIFNSGAHGVTSIDPKNGNVNWELDVLDKRSVSSPVIAAGLIFATCGSGGGGNYVAAVSPPRSKSERPKLAYRVDDSAPYVPTVVAKGNLVFLWSDAGVVSCLEAAGGKQLWKKRVGGSYSGSPVIAGDKLICMSMDGTAVVLAASDEYQLLGKNPLGEESRSTPSIAGGRLYLRTYSHLISLGGK